MNLLKNLKSMIVFFILVFIFLAHESQARGSCTLEIKIQGAIGQATVDYISRAEKRANTLGCVSVLAWINTPGGNLESTRMITERILNSKIPFLCLVGPQGGHAGSAGAILLQSCHVNGALKATNIGAATPIDGMGQNIPEDLRKKIINDTVSWVEGMTILRGRNQNFSKQIITDAKAVSSEEAYRLKAIDLLSEDVLSFLDQARGKEVQVLEKKETVKIGDIEPYRADSRFHVLQIISDPQISYLLFMGSLGLLYFEFTHPGMIAPGVVGAIGLILSLVSFHKLDVWWGGLLLMLLGVAFLFAEAFIPSFGVLGIGGIVAFVLGGMFLFDHSQTAYSLPLATIIPTAIVLGGIMIGIGFLLMHTRKVRVQTGSEEMVGRKAKVRSLSSSRKGKIRVFSELWNFECEEEVEIGQEVEVIALDGLTLIVKKTNKV